MKLLLGSVLLFGLFGCKDKNDEVIEEPLDGENIRKEAREEMRDEVREEVRGEVREEVRGEVQKELRETGIRTTVENFSEIDMPNEHIIDKLMKKYELSYETAEAKLNEYRIQSA